MKRKEFKIKWKILHDIKKWKHRIKRNKNKKEKKIIETLSRETKKKNKDISGVYKATAPEIFSLLINTKETVDYFKKIDKKIYVDKNNIIFIDLHKVKTITNDAIMYLLAKIKKLQHVNLTNNRFLGNSPKNIKAKNVLKESGFYDFVNSLTNTVSRRNKVSIISGDKCEPSVLKRICDFIISNSTYTRDDTYFIYEMLSEMMSNTDEHAYIDNGDDLNKWYIYIEKNEEYFDFTFLDTGVGIPNSINKRFYEKLTKNDSALIKSALDGEYRSSTKLKTRGRGLQYIKECVINNQIESLYVISNKGIVEMKKNEIITNDIVKSTLKGTLYYWKIKREV